MRLYITYNHEGEGSISSDIEKAYTDSDSGIPCLRVIFQDCCIETFYFSEYDSDSRAEQCAKALKWIYQQFEIDESGIAELNSEMHFAGRISGMIKAIDGSGEVKARVAKKNARVEFD